MRLESDREVGGLVSLSQWKVKGLRGGSSFSWGSFKYCVRVERGGGGGHREGSGVHTWSKNSKLTLISGPVSADTSADALAIIIWFKSTEYR